MGSYFYKQSSKPTRVFSLVFRHTGWTKSEVTLLALGIL